VEDVTVSEQKDKPVFDEQTLAKLLEAAYVLQEHSQQLRALEEQLGVAAKSGRENKAEQTFTPELSREQLKKQEIQPSSGSKKSSSEPFSDPDNDNNTLHQILELQGQIENRNLKLHEAMSVIAEHLIDLCGAAGAAIGIHEDKQVCYPAVAGIRTLPQGSCVAIEKAFCSPCLRTGQVFRCDDCRSEPRVDRQECRRRGIGSFIAVPVFQNNDVIGAIEAYYSGSGAFSDQHVQTCQLMAGIITEAIGREEKSVAEFTNSDVEENSASIRQSFSVPCYKCGHELVGKEQFCGQCGAARSEDRESAAIGIQSKVASLWRLQQLTDAGLADRSSEGDSGKHPPSSKADDVDASSLAPELPVDGRPLQEYAALPLEPELDSPPDADLSTGLVPNSAALELSQHHDASSAPDWSSALSALEFLQKMAEGNRRRGLAKIWSDHRGDFYLAMAIILVVCAMRWGLWSGHPVNATSAPPTAPAATHKPAAPEISVFDRFLISVGLADPPEPAQDKGNPSAAVWVDLQTGLYYCSGTDLYGKTPRGKYTGQRDAQLDRFEPAYRQPCK
jgi:putative methionine-R-sulfoxide reductase with GAF domain